MVHTTAIQDLIDDAIQVLTIWMHGGILLQQLESWYDSLVLEATTYTRDVWGADVGWNGNNANPFAVE